jgi:hypothetical protein
MGFGKACKNYFIEERDKNILYVKKIRTIKNIAILVSINEQGVSNE